MSKQIRNDQMVSLLTPDFQRRYEANFSFAKAVSLHLALPKLRGYWPFSSVNESGNVYDLSGQDRTLTNNGTTGFNTSGLVAYADLDGTDDYFSRADEAGLDIIDAISFGGWYKFDTKGTHGLIGKWTTTGNQRAYLLRHKTAPNSLSYEFSRTGSADIVYNFGDFVAVGTWLHVVVIGVAGSGNWRSLAFVNGTAATDNTNIGATALFDSSASLELGAYDGAANFFNGQMCHQFICASALSIGHVFSIFQETRAMFGV